MKTSPEGIRLLHHYESCRLTAYPDPATGGAPWTIGWGHTGSEVKPGMTWTQARADAEFVKDLERFEREVSSLVKVPLKQYQFDALVSFSYNVGSDIDTDTIAEGLGDSSLLKFVNSAMFDKAANQFQLWNRANGQVMRGLTRRRHAERALFLGANSGKAIAIGTAAA